MELKVILILILAAIVSVAIGLVTNVVSSFIPIPQSTKQKILWILALIALAPLSALIALLLQAPIPDALAEACKGISTSDSNFSTGEKLLIPQKENARLYERKIYANNGRITGDSVLLAAVVPADENARPEAAGAILAGVADAQEQFNQRREDPTSSDTAKPLRVLVVNDSNTVEGAKQVACQIARDYKDVVGIIGHHSSDASKAAVDIYNKAGLAMITPTSTSTSLNQSTVGKVFFRSTYSSRELADVLAKHIEGLNVGKIAIFYDEGEYSTNIRGDFIKSLKDKNIIHPIPFDNLQPVNYSEKSVPKSLPAEVKSVIFFSSGGRRGTNERAIRIIEYLKDSGRDLKIFGGNALYEGETLAKGKKKIENLVLVVPWFGFPKYAYRETTFDGKEGGQIGWRTANSFDATRAFLRAISLIARNSETVNRQTILEKLPSVNLPANATSGEPLRFEAGQRQGGEPVLVQVVPKSNQVSCGFEVCFQPLQR
ncbi:ABC transporter substrate-binding protein [Leptolyngbya sp. AN10]|uniref:ABC transporter substrate-binding protein n=1 Tax=Leptolyngbya sp. AN10 TaxID=3423365 RepID=UPI003D32360B